MKSEFPKTRMFRFGKYFGWIFSPILFILLLVYTFFSAQGLKLDFTTGNVEKNGFVDIKEITASDVYFDNVLVGRTGRPLNTNKVDSAENPLAIKIVKSDGRTWEKSITPKDGRASILYPILYPSNLTFDKEVIQALNYYNSDNGNVFFYEKIENNKLNLYRYSVQRLLFGISVRNELVLDITPYASKLTTDVIPMSAETLKTRKVIPGSAGKRTLLTLINERAYIIGENGNAAILPNYLPKADDKIIWAANEDYIIIRTGRDILSYNVNTNVLNTVYKSTQENENVEIQFITKNAIVYKVSDEVSIDLLENNFQGNMEQKIDIPNIDNLRKNNLIKAYDMLEKLNLILLQTEKSIYSFNLTTYELKKFNKFENEELVYNDSFKQIVVTKNSKSNNQFRSYNLETTESKTFTLNDIDPNVSPDKIKGFNQSNTLILNYLNQIKYIDIDGTNELKFQSNNDPKVVIAVKEDTNVVLVNSQTDTSEEVGVNKLRLSVERFEN
jgi:hypothetical protein